MSLAIAEILSGGSVIHLDMSTIVEAEAICGSAPIFENSQPGIIFTALARNRASSATVIVNEIDKAFDNVGAGKSRGASCAAALLSLMDKERRLFGYVCWCPDSFRWPVFCRNGK